jgi:hypothetical protein
VSPLGLPRFTLPLPRLVLPLPRFPLPRLVLSSPGPAGARFAVKDVEGFVKNHVDRMKSL